MHRLRWNRESRPTSGNGAAKSGNLRTKNTTTVMKNCVTCDGSGYLRAPDPNLLHSAGVFVHNLAAVKRDSAQTPNVLSGCYKMITDVMVGDYKTWMLLTDAGKGVLAQPKIDPGTPIISKVTVLAALPKEGDKRGFLVAIVGTEQKVRIYDPTIADDIQGGTALVGGLYMPGDKNDPTPMLQGGFIVSPNIDGSWWWWSGIRPPSRGE